MTRAGCDKLAQNAAHADRARFDGMAQKLGYTLGSELYDSYLAGRVSRSALRRLFLANLEEPGEARKTCLKLALELRSHHQGAKTATAGS